MNPFILYINELGPVRHAEVAFNRLTVLTGGSGLGKSYVGLALYHCIDSIHFKLSDFLSPKFERMDVQEGQTFEFEFTWEELRLWLNRTASGHIGYLIGNTNFHCDLNYVFDLEGKEPGVSVSFTPRKKEGMDASVIFDIHINGRSLVREDYVSRSLEVMDGVLSIYLSEQLGMDLAMSVLFPPSRSVFSGLNFGPQKLFATIGMYNEFIRDLDLLNHLPSADMDEDRQFFQSMAKKLLGGELVMKDNEAFLLMPGDKRIPLRSAASSIKELAPFMQILKYKYLGYLSVFFEEPEAHVHPLKQIYLADIIARCVNKGTVFQITTHSDYLLSRFNQLIRLGNLRKHDESLFNLYCEENRQSKKLYLDSDMVSAYVFEEEDGSVAVRRLDCSDGVPFDTFGKAIDLQISEADKLGNFLNLHTDGSHS